jgi:hypothetical protein
MTLIIDTSTGEPSEFDVASLPTSTLISFTADPEVQAELKRRMKSGELTASTAFHLPGKHDQKRHGRRRGWAGRTTYPDDMPDDLRKEIETALAPLSRDYTLPVKRVMWTDPEIHGYPVATKSRDTIYVNKDLATDRAAFEAKWDSADYTVSGHDLGIVITHEYGHMLDNALGFEDEKAFHTIHDQSWFKDADTYHRLNKISIYAGENGFEAVAELFAAYRTGKVGKVAGDENTINDPMIHLVGTTFDRHFGGTR